AGHPIARTKTSGKGPFVCRHDRDKIAFTAGFFPDSSKLAAIGGAFDRAAIKFVASFYMITGLYERYSSASMMPGAVPLARPVELGRLGQRQQKPNKDSQDRTTEKPAEINV